MLNQCQLAAVGVIIADSPYICSRDGRYGVQPTVSSRIWAGNGVPICTIPMKDERGSAASIRFIPANSPHVIRCDGGDAVEKVIRTRMIWAANDLPTGAVPMLDQRLPVEIGVVISDAPKFNSAGHMGHSNQAAVAVRAGTEDNVPSAAA